MIFITMAHIFDNNKSQLSLQTWPMQIFAQTHRTFDYPEAQHAGLIKCVVSYKSCTVTKCLVMALSSCTIEAIHIVTPALC